MSGGWRYSQGLTYVFPLIVLVATWLVIAQFNPRFVGLGSIFGVVQGFGLVGLVALGLAVTIIAGELDLSVGSMAALAGVIAILCTPLGTVAAILIPTLVGVLFGAAQGNAIGWLRINSLVFTIGTLIMLRGIAYLASGHAPISVPNDLITVTDPLIARYKLFGVNVATLGSVVALVVFVLTGLFLAYTRWGREIHAIGGARDEALAAGVPLVRPMAVAFAFSAGCASLAGAMATLRGGTAAPQNYEDLLLSGAAAALLGGISLYGGRGTVLNVALGVAILSVISAGLSPLGTPASIIQLVTGALLLTVVGLEYVATGLLLSRTVFGRRLFTPD
ncbi:MAG: ABC transporter permease [Geminicoccaceae bacterium]